MAAIGADRHVGRKPAGGDAPRHNAGAQINHRQCVFVIECHIQGSAVRAELQSGRAGAQKPVAWAQHGQSAHHCLAAGIDYLDFIEIAVGNIEVSLIGREHHPVRFATYGDHIEGSVRAHGKHLAISLAADIGPRKCPFRTGPDCGPVGQLAHRRLLARDEEADFLRYAPVLGVHEAYGIALHVHHRQRLAIRAECQPGRDRTRAAADSADQGWRFPDRRAVEHAAVVVGQGLPLAGIMPEQNERRIRRVGACRTQAGALRGVDIDAVVDPGGDVEMPAVRRPHCAMICVGQRQALLQHRRSAAHVIEEYPFGVLRCHRARLTGYRIEHGMRDRRGGPGIEIRVETTG